MKLRSGHASRVQQQQLQRAAPPPHCLRSLRHAVLASALPNDGRPVLGVPQVVSFRSIDDDYNPPEQHPHSATRPLPHYGPPPGHSRGEGRFVSSTRTTTTSEQAHGGVHLPTRLQLMQQSPPTAHLQPEEEQQLLAQQNGRGSSPNGVQGQGVASTPNGQARSDQNKQHEQHEHQQRSAPAGPPPPLASLDADALPPDFKPKRLLCFAGILAAYTGLYLTRGTLTYAAPALVADAAMGVTLRDVGAMTTAFPLAYGLSKFVGGVMGAKFSPTLMLVGGLAATALLNLGAALPGVGVAALTGIWALNGCLQGIGAPASAQLLTRWFASKERGTFWGLWNMGANLGGFATPLVVGGVAAHLGWRYGMALPGLAALLIASLAMLVVRDSPAAAGFGNAEEGPKAAAPAQDGKGASSSSPILEALGEVLASRECWLLALTYFFVYVVRQGATSWLVFFLMSTKGAADAATAARLVSGLELGGLVGGTLAGLLSDISIRRAEASKEGAQQTVGHVGRRVQIVMASLTAMFGVLAALKFVPAQAQALQWLAIAALGMTIYPAHMLIGLCGAELVRKPAVGASQGFLGLIAYIGAANAGIPLSWVVSTHGWDAYLATLAAAAGVALCLLAPLWNAKSELQRRTEAAAALA